MNTPLPKAAGYARVSTAHQADQGVSLSTQEEQIQAYCKARGWELTGIYVDRGISGASMERPQYQAMVKAAEQGQFEHLVVTRLSRFARSTLNCLAQIEALGEHGVAVHTIKENLSTDKANPTGRLMLHVLSAVAQFERDVIADQTNENRLAKWREGKARVGTPPYGYQWAEDNEDFLLVPVEEEAQVYRQMLQLYMAGNSLSAIANTLNADKVPARRSKWTMGTVQGILRSPVYAGTWTVNQTKFKGTKRAGAKPASEHITLEVPPLITPEQWQALQQRIDDARGGTKRSPYYEQYWLRGQLQCGVCGARMHVFTLKNKGGHKLYYACQWTQCSKKYLKANGRTSTCSMPVVPAEELHHQVWFTLMSRYTLAGNLDRHIGKLLAPGGSGDKQREKLTGRLYSTKNKLAKAERAEARVLALLGEEAVDGARVKQMLAKAHADIAQLTAQATSLKAELAEIDNARAERQALAEYAQQHRAELVALGNQLKALPVQYRNAFIANSLGGRRIKIRGGKEAVPGRKLRKGWWHLNKSEVPGPNIKALKLLAEIGAINWLDNREP